MNVCALHALGRFLLAGGSVAAFAGASVPAQAQNAEAGQVDTNEAADAGTEPNAQEIVVTANKRVERLQDVAASVSVLTAENLTNQGLVKFEDYAAQVPGLSLTSARAGLTQVTLRGITTGPAQSASATAFYVDEAPIGSVNAYTGGSSTTPDLDPSDLSRLEILKGPQGTIYGAGAVGGLVKFVTVDPDFDTLSGRISAAVNSVRKGGEGYALRAALNLPLVTDKLALRASGFRRKDAGYIDIVQSPTVSGKDVNEVKVSGGRLVLAGQLGENVRLDIQGIAQDTDVDGTNVIDVNATTLEPCQQDRRKQEKSRKPHMQTPPHPARRRDIRRRLSARCA